MQWLSPWTELWFRKKRSVILSDWKSKNDLHLLKKLVTVCRKHNFYLTFSGIGEQLPAEHFVRIHKSFLVTISAIQTIDGKEVITSLMRLPLSKIYRNDVLSRIDCRFIKRWWLVWKSEKSGHFN